MSKQVFLLIALSASLASFSAYSMGPSGGAAGGGMSNGRGPSIGNQGGGVERGQPGGNPVDGNFGPGSAGAPGQGGGAEQGQPGGNPGNNNRGAGGPGGAGAAGPGGPTGGVRFRDLDRNGDGYISRSEARADPTLDRNFDRYDREGTGKLTQSQFQQFERDQGTTGQGAPGAGARGGNAR